MRYSISCSCGYETPLVENEEDIDWELLEIHQEYNDCPNTKWRNIF